MACSRAADKAAGNGSSGEVGHLRGILPSYGPALPVRLSADMRSRLKTCTQAGHPRRPLVRNNAAVQPQDAQAPDTEPEPEPESTPGNESSLALDPSPSEACPRLTAHDLHMRSSPPEPSGLMKNTLSPEPQTSHRILLLYWKNKHVESVLPAGGYNHGLVHHLRYRYHLNRGNFTR